MDYVGKIITISETEFVVLDCIKKNNKEYLFTNELVDGDITRDYYVFEVNGSEVFRVSDLKLLNEITLEFSERLRK